LGTINAGNDVTSAAYKSISGAPGTFTCGVCAKSGDGGLSLGKHAASQKCLTEHGWTNRVAISLLADCSVDADTDLKLANPSVSQLVEKHVELAQVRAVAP
jgi:hypothetical protein